MNFSISLSIFTEVSWDSDWNYTESVVGDIVILAMLSVPVYEQGMFFQKFSSLILSAVFCSFQSITFVLFVQFIPKLFFLSDPITNGI